MSTVQKDKDSGLRVHWHVLKNAFQDEKSKLRTPLRNDVELEFLPAYLEVLERPPSKVGRLLSISIMLFCACTLAWSTFGKLDIISSAPGKLVVGQYSKTVQAADAGVVTKISVWNGQAVKRGDVLVELNPTSAKADARRLAWQADVTALSVARYEALLSESPLTRFQPPRNIDEELLEQARSYLEGEWEVFSASQKAQYSQLEQINAERKALEASIIESELLLKTVGEVYAAIEPLAESGNLQRLELLQRRQELIETRRTLTEQTSNLTVLDQKAQTLQTEMAKQKAQWRQDILAQLQESRSRLVDLRQELIKARETARQQTVVAPVDGVVQQVTINTIGAVVSPGAELMTIVPDKLDLEAEVNILNKDIGFVLPGQKVEVKVESFPYTKFGTLKGSVLHVSKDSIEDEQLGLVYRARVVLDELQFYTGETYKAVSAGMLVTAEIKTGNRRVIDYLLSPLEEYQSEALKER